MLVRAGVGRCVRLNANLLVRMASSSAPYTAENAAVDRERFSKVLTVKALRVPSRRCQHVLKQFHEFVLERPRIRPIQKDGDKKDTRLLLLNEQVSGDGGELVGLSDDLHQEIDKEGLEPVDFEVKLDYSHFSADYVLRELMPEGVEVPTSFETIGHIAHLNLRDEHFAYKNVIGQVILDKNPTVKTVVNKVGTVENEYRVFEMEVLAGKADFETEVKQHGIRFKLDYSKVYWNSRLEYEHARLVSTFKKDDVICDMMAGIGPFAIPAGLNGCEVLANDLNPCSYEYLERNIKLNKVGKRVRGFNMDGRDFVRKLVGVGHANVDVANAEANEADSPVFFNHVIMNLPASAIEFLDVFNGIFDMDRWKDKLPMIHCYTFMKAVETEEDIVRKCEHYLGGELPTRPFVHRVRDVAPNKIMLCVSFKLPGSIAFVKRDEGKPGVEQVDDEFVDQEAVEESQEKKRQRTS